MKKPLEVNEYILNFQRGIGFESMVASTENNVRWKKKAVLLVSFACLSQAFFFFTGSLPYHTSFRTKTKKKQVKKIIFRKEIDMLTLNAWSIICVELKVT